MTLIDTPGFDDTNKTDTEILTAIANYLENKCVVVLLSSLRISRANLSYISYRKHRLLSGIIFLRRITDNRMGGVSNKNVLMFQKLVGNSVLDHVICCSTMWDRVEQSQGEFEGRENELRDKFWANMVANGAQMARHDNTAQSASLVINKLLNLKPVVLMIQQELVDGQKKLFETSAGKEVEELVLAAQQERELQETNARLERERAENEVRLAMELEQQRQARNRMLWEQEQVYAMLEAEREEERRRLEALADEAERRAQAAREERERVRFALQNKSNQRASFGIILQTAYDPSNILHWSRIPSMSAGEQVVGGYWAQMIEKVSMSLCLVRRAHWVCL